MSLTADDRAKCVKVYKFITGDTTAAGDWNQAAADELGNLVAGIRGCTKAFKFLPSPVGSTPGWGYLAVYVEDILTRVTEGEVAAACVKVASSHKSAIVIALGMGY